MKPNTLSQRRRRMKFYKAGRNYAGEPYQRKPRVFVKPKAEPNIELTQREKEWAKMRSEMTTQQDEMPFA